MTSQSQVFYKVCDVTLMASQRRLLHSSLKHMNIMTIGLTDHLHKAAFKNIRSLQVLGNVLKPIVCARGSCIILEVLKVTRMAHRTVKCC